MDVVRRELARLNILYPRKLSGDELEVAARTWAKDLREFPDQEFLAAMADIRKTLRFFPTPAEAREACQEAARRMRPPPPAFCPGPEARAAQLAVSRRGVRKILDMLRG